MAGLDLFALDYPYEFPSDEDLAAMPEKGIRPVTPHFFGLSVSSAMA